MMLNILKGHWGMGLCRHSNTLFSQSFPDPVGLYSSTAHVHFDTLHRQAFSDPVRFLNFNVLSTTQGHLKMLKTLAPVKNTSLNHKFV